MTDPELFRPLQEAADQPPTIDQQIAADYQTLVEVLPAGNTEVQLALARLTQTATIKNEEAEAARAEARDLRRQAFVSPVTGMPNRNALINKAATASAAAEVRRRRAAEGTFVHRVAMPAGFMTLFFDLDRFKEVNDIYGHDQGDRLLWLAGRAIQLSIREDDEAYHLSGDEFAAFLRLAEPKTPEAVAADVHAEFSGNLQRQIDGDPLAIPDGAKLTGIDHISLRTVGATIGAHWSEGPYLDRLAMLTIAETAMRANKISSRDR